MPERLLAPEAPLAGKALRGRGAVLATCPPAARFVLCGGSEVAEAAAPAFGLSLPDEPCRARRHGERAALWLGPDEWLLIAPAHEGEAILMALASALGGQAHSLVDVSHRQTALSVSGAGAEPVLNSGCPLDLDPRAFPVDAAARTVFGKAEIVLWRCAAEGFHVEVARSFASYVFALLDEAVRQHDAATR